MRIRLLLVVSVALMVLLGAALRETPAFAVGEAHHAGQAITATPAATATPSASPPAPHSPAANVEDWTTLLLPGAIAVIIGLVWLRRRRGGPPGPAQGNSSEK